MVPVRSYSAPYSGVITAQDANNDINPAEIQAAVNEFKATCENVFNDITERIKGIEPEACDAVIVQRSTIGPKMEDSISNIKSLASKVANQFEDLYAKAERKHDELQIKYNSEAEARAAAEYARYQNEQRRM